ncbi:hypothetical protein [Brevundimonas sp. CEF1]|uniref:hypothetical protein n=1 Tax=Brevundimonas sp. CEF1 TaxID=3442642 RepID=UPI003F5194E9
MDALTVKSLAAAPTVDESHGLFRFETEEAGRIALAIPREKLPGLAGLAIAYATKQTPGISAERNVTALEIDGFDLLADDMGGAVISFLIEGVSHQLPFHLTAEAVAALKQQLALV